MSLASSYSDRDFDPRREPAVTVTLTSRAALRLEVVLRPEAVAAAQSWFSDESGVVVFRSEFRPAPRARRHRDADQPRRLAPGSRAPPRGRGRRAILVFR